MNCFSDLKRSGIYLAIGVLHLLGCDLFAGSESNSILDDCALTILPGQEIDLGSFAAESIQTATFTLTNTTTSPVSIKNLLPCCPIIDPVLYETTIPSSSSTPLDVTVDASQLNSPFKKSISFVSPPLEKKTTLWIKGAPIPAISVSSPRIFTGNLPLDKTWSTNLTVSIRQDLSGTLQTTTRSSLELNSSVLSNKIIRLMIPPQKKPSRWEGSVLINIQETNTPPAVILLDGYIGGCIYPGENKLYLYESSRQAKLPLYWSHVSAPSSPPPITCIPETVHAKQTFSGDRKSTATLHFSPQFIQQLKIKKRIPIQLQTEGYIPARILAIFSNEAE